MTYLAARTVCLFATIGFATLVAASRPAVGSKRVANRTYVQSGPDGALYARCTPAAEEGAAGRTNIFMVGATEDQRVDRYEWYAPGGVTLGWSPVVGKVAVLAVIAEPKPDGDWRAREELRFAIGGKVLRSYTAGQLVDLGAEEVVSRPGGRRAGYRLVGCQQVPLTNEYDFVVEVAGGAKGEGTILRFDITTGALRPGRPRVPLSVADHEEAVRVARAFMTRTHPGIGIDQKPPTARYVADAGGKPMWVVTFAAGKSAGGDGVAADRQFYAFDVRIRPDGQVESTTSPEP